MRPRRQDSFRALYRAGSLEGTEVEVEVAPAKAGGNPVLGGPGTEVTAAPPLLAAVCRRRRPSAAALLL